MAGKVKPEGTAWRRRQGTAAEQVREDLAEAIQAKRAKEAATPDNDMSADFTLRLAKAQAFAKQHGLKWEGPCTYGLAVAHVEYRAARANHLIQGLAARVAALEKQLAETKTVADHTEKRAMRFAGNFVMEHCYAEGSVTIYKGMCYVAGRDVSANLAYPPRQGSGWIPLT